MDSATLNNLLHQTTPASAVMATLPAVLGGVLLFVVLGGFAILDTGLVRSKNAAHAVATSLLAFAGAILGFWVLGFGLQGGAAPSVGVGQDRGVVGADGFLFDAGAAPLATAALFVLRAIAAAIVAAIPGGAVGERVRLRAVLALALVGAGLIYPVYAYWVWGGGWLASLGRSAGLGHGVVDRAGAAVIHLTGGVMALVAAKMLGPRLGKYSLRGQVRPIPAHNSPLVVLGTLLLAAGWFGLLCLQAPGTAEARPLVTATNALLGAAAGALFAFIYTRVRFSKPDLSLICNGLLAGLIGVSAAAPFVSSASAVVIGAIAALLVIESALFIERRLRIDDPAGAGAVHGVAGAWGLLALGLFSNGSGGAGLGGVATPVRGLFHGDGGQLVASLVGVVANVVWVVPVTVLALVVIGRTLGLRVSPDDEIAGLDVPELGMTGYVNETMHGAATRSNDIGHSRGNASA